MKYLAWLVALFVIAAGVTGIVAPDRLMSLRWMASTQMGLLGFAVLRATIGVVLIMVAPSTRAPKTLQACGAVMLLAGMVTPLFGVERTKAVLDWEVAQGQLLIRAGAVVIVAIGGCLAFALATRRKAL
jgi:hypothetical protein